MELLNVFTADYSVIPDASLPVDAYSRDFVAPGVAMLSPAVEISVKCATGEAWHGRFFGDFGDAGIVVNGPGPGVLIVVAAGVAYVVQVNSPSTYRTASVWPIRSVRYSVTHKVVVLASFTDVEAIGDSGEIIWAVRGLVSDGFSDVRLEEHSLIVVGYDAPQGSDVEATLDLDSGTVIARQSIGTAEG